MRNHGLILLVDDEETMREAAGQWLTLAGFAVEPCATAERALQRLGPEFPGILVTDVKMPRMDGLALMQECLGRDADLPVVLMTGHGDVAMAVAAMREGAYDFIEKPFAPETLVDIVRRAMEKRRLVLENRALQAELRQASGIDALLLGQSPEMVELRRTVADLAGTGADVLVHGETGTGKEQVARGLHAGSGRGRRPLVAINCAALPEPLFESELFGHEAGAFTGAARRRVGKLEHADGGTLFLDEIESMPLSLQVKLLRVLQERTVERLGANEPLAVDFRVVAATKTDLLKASAAGSFREDLYYRLSVAEIHIPPLRERREDIPLLFEHFCRLASLSYQRQAPAPRPADLQALIGHAWPGNVRELKNIAERYVLAGGARSAAELLKVGAAGEKQSLARQVEAFEKSMILQELRRLRGDMTAVMATLGLPRRTLNEKMRKYRLSRRDYRDPSQN